MPAVKGGLSSIGERVSRLAKSGRLRLRSVLSGPLPKSVDASPTGLTVTMSDVALALPIDTGRPVSEQVGELVDHDQRTHSV
jgi:hypothetical protein